MQLHDDVTTLGDNATLTAVPGIQVGHATAPQGGTGCTVVLGPFRAAVEVTGMATGSRELGVLDPRHLAPQVDALLLTGGSAFGLSAADGVMAWLAERGLGYDTGVATVPVVPTAVIFDLAEGVARPDAALGRLSCTVASTAPVAEGRVGVGAGATVGKFAGNALSSPGGVGSAAGRLGSHTLGALAVVNALGNVRDPAGRVVAGARGAGETDWLDPGEFIRASVRAGDPPVMARPGVNTTLGVVATDAPLSRVELARVVRMAATALSRRIDPVNTPFDGDLVFAVSTSREHADVTAGEALALGVGLRELLEEAIMRAVTPGR